MGNITTTSLNTKPVSRTNVMGKYKPKNKTKFDGKVCIYRSLWERKVMLYCDRSPSVVRWSSESVAIPYYDASSKKWRTYYPDFCIEYIDNACCVRKKLIEVKPASQCSWKVNKSKWKAAELWCAETGYEFQVLTEKEIKP
jgi:hypothetical protein